jgi:hypothetical protein
MKKKKKIQNCFEIKYWGCNHAGEGSCPHLKDAGNGDCIFYDKVHEYDCTSPDAIAEQESDGK